MNQAADMAMRSIPPQNLEAEQGVLGSICLSNEALDDVTEVLRSEHFFSERHRLIFEAVQAMLKRGVHPDAVTLSEELARSGKLDIVGGDTYLIQILEAVPNAAHARYYADIVVSRWTARRISEISGKAHAAVVHGTETPDEILAEASGEFHRLMESTVQSGPVNMSDALESLDARWASGSDRGLMTGFPVLDEFLGGLRPGSVYVPAARPGAGKTALAVCIAHNVASQGLGTLIFSLEMEHEDVTQRLLTLESGLPFKQLSKVDQLDEMERDQLADAQNSLSTMPIHIDDSPNISLQHIAAVTRLYCRRHRLSLVVVDYLQLVKSSNRSDLREQQVAEISRELKSLARAVGIPILLLAQLNRAVEHRDSRRPRLSDLRESGSVEQDADAVLFIDRPFLNNPEADPRDATLIIGKNRHGPTGDIPLHWDGRLMQFEEAILV